MLQLILQSLLICLCSALHHTTFCMITSKRPVSYVNVTVSSFLKQQVNAYDGVGFIVVDVDNSSNLSFPVYKLIDRTIETCDAPEQEANNDLLWLPDCEIRQSVLDVGSALKFCSLYTSGWLVLVEDDCTLCPGGLDEIVVTLSKLDYQNTSTARFSKSSRGTAFPVNKINAYVEHIIARRKIKSYDIHDPAQWFGTGTAYIHKRNLFHHIGYVSTSLHKNDELFHATYDSLRADDGCFSDLK
jgi:hypothetical protein